MSGRTLEDVISATIAVHEEFGGGWYCRCTPEDADGIRGMLPNGFDEHLAAHVAAEVRAWIEDVLSGEDVLEAVGEAIAWTSGEVTINGEPDAAIEVVRGRLAGEGEA